MTGKNWPMMFWIHGGGWQTGGGADVTLNDGPGHAGDPATKELLAFGDPVVQP